VLVLYKFDHVGPSLPHLVELVAEFERRQVDFRVLTGESDTSSASGRVVLHSFAALAEF
jgi:DNA invertase Pin-like site-specific DNA recombinase